MEEKLWINIKQIAIYIRYGIEKKYNSDLIALLIQTIVDRKENDFMCTEIREIAPDIEEELEKGGSVILKNNFVIEMQLFFKCAFENMLYYIENKQYDIAYDIADIIQALPEKEFMEDKKCLKQFWKIYV